MSAVSFRAVYSLYYYTASRRDSSFFVVFDPRIVNRRYTGVPIIFGTMLLLYSAVGSDQNTTWPDEANLSGASDFRLSSFNTSSAVVGGMTNRASLRITFRSPLPHHDGAFDRAFTNSSFEIIVTTTGKPNRSFIAVSHCAISFGTLVSFASKNTFPLLMYVETFSNPRSKKHCLKSLIDTLLLPPTLIPRRRQTYFIYTIIPT